jgi:hypothetical protein
VVTVIPAPSDAAPATSGPPPQVDTSPIPLESLVPESPDPTTTPAAATTPKRDDSDGLTRIVQLLVAAAAVLGIGGGVGLYLTRSHG